jgi:hypothetical protein
VGISHYDHFSERDLLTRVRTEAIFSLVVTNLLYPKAQTGHKHCPTFIILMLLHCTFFATFSFQTFQGCDAIESNVKAHYKDVANINTDATYSYMYKYLKERSANRTH